MEARDLLHLDRPVARPRSELGVGREHGAGREHVTVDVGHGRQAERGALTIDVSAQETVPGHDHQPPHCAVGPGRERVGLNDRRWVLARGQQDGAVRDVSEGDAVQLRRRARGELDAGGEDPVDPHRGCRERCELSGQAVPGVAVRRAQQREPAARQRLGLGGERLAHASPHRAKLPSPLFHGRAEIRRRAHAHDMTGAGEGLGQGDHRVDVAPRSLHSQCDSHGVVSATGIRSLAASAAPALA